MPSSAIWASAPRQVDSMECLDCGHVNDHPAGRSIKISEAFSGDIDVDLGAEDHVQLECTECGAVLGYIGVGAAVGESNVRGYY